MLPRHFLSALAVAAVMAAPTLALAQQSNHLRGTVSVVDGDQVTLETKDGETVSVSMTPDYMLIVYDSITVADLKPGDFLSIPALPGTDGSITALSINVFPEAMRGLGEGRSVWDSSEGSTMVNATIGTVTATDGGTDVTVSYKDTEQDVVVPEGTPITRIVPTPTRRLVEGDQAFVAVREDGGTVQGAFAGIMADGSMPAM